ncbi:MAG: hypothetical protein JJT85_07345 [Chromatiales bacterium]|nr:hypothetical protein [Chromatiales bacterium]
MKKMVVIASAGLLALAADVGATPITLQYTGFVAGSQNGQITNGSSTQSVAAGQFNFNVINDGGVYWDDTLQAFCIDVDNRLVTGGQVVYDFTVAAASSRLSGAQLALVGQLYENNAGSLGSSLNDAAFQLAVWEIVFEPNPTSLDDGLFSSSSFGANGGARAIANGWLAALDTSSTALSAAWEFYVLEPLKPKENQALIVARPVPVSEPGMMLLLAGGLGLLVGLRRRRV